MEASRLVRPETNGGIEMFNIRIGQSNLLILGHKALALIRFVGVPSQVGAAQGGRLRGICCAGAR